MQNYTGHGWEGKDYDRNLTMTEIAKRVKAQLKETFPGCKFSVTSEYYAGGSSLHIYLMEADFFVFVDGGIGHLQVNNYYIDKETDLTDWAKEVLKRAKDFAQSFNYDDSDGMIDYFSTNFYLHLNVGKWDRPFKMKEEVFT